MIKYDHNSHNTHFCKIFKISHHFQRILYLAKEIKSLKNKLIIFIIFLKLFKKNFEKKNIYIYFT